MFRPLNREHVRKIVQIQFRRVQELLKQQGIGIELSDAALDYIPYTGFDQVFGARPLKRLIQNEIINRLSTELLKEHFSKGDRIVVGCEDGRLVFLQEKENKSVA